RARGCEDRLVRHPEAAEVDRPGGRRRRHGDDHERCRERGTGEDPEERSHRAELCTRLSRWAKFAGMVGTAVTSTKPHPSAELHRLFQEGQRAWPGLALPLEVFVRYLGARGGGGDPSPTVRAPDLFLACACAAQIRGAIEAFDRVHLRPVDGYLARMR